MLKLTRLTRLKSDSLVSRSRVSWPPRQPLSSAKTDHAGFLLPSSPSTLHCLVLRIASLASRPLTLDRLGQTLAYPSPQLDPLLLSSHRKHLC